MRGRPVRVLLPSCCLRCQSLSVYRPPDEVLKSLGLLSWCSIEAEDRIRALAARILGAEGGKELGRVIGRALAALRKLPTHPEVDQATEWLDRARDAMIARNTVLHATPGTFAVAPGDGGVEMYEATYLLHTHDMGGLTQRELSSDELDKIAAELSDIVGVWPLVFVSLSLHLRDAKSV